jgi:hypothetical protein
MTWLLVPFFFQGIVMFFDEFYYHHRRGLPLWERLGHPVDTLSLLACMLYLLWVPYSPGALKGYIALALTSSLLVTKDEFVHAEVCPKGEHFVHALLFLLHPTILALAGLVWPVIPHDRFVQVALSLYSGSMALFCLYQIFFWNFLWQRRCKKQ